MEEKASLGSRDNEGKPRFDLIPADMERIKALIYTLGSIKYEDRNWEKGMKFSTILASLRRHVNALERGEDIDPDTGIAHFGSVIVNAEMLGTMMKAHPELDDRPKFWQKERKIALDIDGVLANFYEAFVKEATARGIGTPDAMYENQFHWNLLYSHHPLWEIIHKDEEAVEDFFVNKVQPFPVEVPFEPTCYITARKIDSRITQRWLEKHNFPCVPVYSTNEQSKVDILVKNQIDIFVDDAFHNFVDINNSGLTFCYLMDAPYNRKYDVGHMRIYKLSDIITGDHLIHNYPDRIEYYKQQKALNKDKKA